MNRSTPQLELAPARGLWWLHPTWAFALVNGLTMAAALLLSESAYQEYGTGKFINGEYFALALLGIAAFAAGQWLAKATGATPRPLSPAARSHLTNWFWAAIGLTLLGYLIWFGGGMLRAGSLEPLRAIWNLDESADVPEIRGEIFATIPGVTTCTQFGMAAVGLGLLCCGTSSGEKRSKTVRRVLLAILFGLAAMRMLLVSERLALIELVVPAALLILRLTLLARENLSRAALRRLAIAPLAGLVGIVVLFGSAEYFRSWRFYQDRFDSLAEFTLWRMSGYYTTGHNNGAMAMQTRGVWPMPYYTLESFWRFPLVAGSPLSYSAVNGIDPDEVHTAMLVRYGTPELNNQGGLFSPAMDFGWVGYVVFWSFYGFIAGRLHRGFLAGSLGGLLFYPLVFMSLLEVPRLLYVCSVRSFPSLMLMGVVVGVEVWRGRSVAAGAPERSQLMGARS